MEARDGRSLAQRARQIQHRHIGLESADGGILLDPQTIPNALDDNVLDDVSLDCVYCVGAARACAFHLLLPLWRRRHSLSFGFCLLLRRRTPLFHYLRWRPWSPRFSQQRRLRVNDRPRLFGWRRKHWPWPHQGGNLRSPRYRVGVAKTCLRLLLHHLSRRQVFERAFPHTYKTRSLIFEQNKPSLMCHRHLSPAPPSDLIYARENAYRSRYRPYRFQSRVGLAHHA